MSRLWAGRARGRFYRANPLISDYVSQVLFIGEDASKIEADLQASGLDELVETHQCGTLDDAMQTVQTLTSSSLSQIAGVLFRPLVPVLISLPIMPNGAGGLANWYKRCNRCDTHQANAFSLHNKSLNITIKPIPLWQSLHPIHHL